VNILIFGNRYFSINESIGSAFQQHGHLVQVLNYRDAWYPKIFCRNPIRRRRSVACFREIQSGLKREIELARPDVLFTLSGNVILPETLQWIRERGIVVVLFLLDSIHRLPLTQIGLEWYHLIYVFEPTDIPFISPKNANIAYLAPAYNPDFYHPIPGAEKKYDVTFVGTPYGQRLEILNQLCKLALEKDIRVALVGKYWHRGYRKLAFRLSYPYIYRFVLKNGVMDPKNVNLLYNQSKVVLNHHIDMNGEAVNCRLFDIAGAGALQLVENRKMRPETFRPGEEVVTYASVEELKAKADYFVKNPVEAQKIANAAALRARAEHTYFHRSRRIITDISRVIARDLPSQESSKRETVSTLFNSKNQKKAQHLQ